jgi:signal transduction histidine kinase
MFTSISHEFRNPLNSIHASFSHFENIFEKFSQPLFNKSGLQKDIELLKKFNKIGKILASPIQHSEYDWPPHIQHTFKHIVIENTSFVCYMRGGPIDSVCGPKTSCLTLLSMVEDILDLAKLDSKNFLIHESEFKIGDIIKEIEYIFKYQCEQRKIKFEIDNRTNADKFISDPKRIKQVLLNLISNSVKFTMEGKITLEIENDATHLIFKVIDTGIGIQK